MKSENNEISQENETLNAEIWSLKQQIGEMNEENERTNRRNNTPDEDNTPTNIEETILLTDSNGLRVIEHFTNRRSVKHVTNYRMQDVVDYTESKKHLDRPMYTMVGTNDILDGKPAEDIIETLKTPTQQLKNPQPPIQAYTTAPNRTSTEADHETICYSRMIAKMYPNNTIKTAELYKTKDLLMRDNIHLTPEGAKIVVKELESRMPTRNLTHHPKQDRANSREEKQPPANHHQTRQLEQDNTTSTMAIKSEYTGRVIGKGGENKRRIQAKHNTTIKIEDRGEETKITIFGTPRNCQLTKQDIQDTIDKARNDRETKIRKQQRLNSETCWNGPNCKFGDKCWYRHDPHPPTHNDARPTSQERTPPPAHYRREHRS